MSKVGKKPIDIVSGVDVNINESSITVRGPKGSATREIPRDLNIKIDNNQIVITLSADEASISGKRKKELSAIWGLYRSLIENMIKGGSQGFEKVLEFEGVGYKASLKGNDLELNLGYSHPITVKAPEGITFKVEKSSITVMGSDKELVGHVAANIRSKRLPEPYQGSGIRYAGEHIARKSGKKAASGA